MTREADRLDMLPTDQDRFAVERLDEAAHAVLRDVGRSYRDGFWGSVGHSDAETFDTFRLVIESGPECRRFAYAMKAIAELRASVLCMIPVLFDGSVTHWCVFIRTEFPIDRGCRERMARHICPGDVPDDFFR